MSASRYVMSDQARNKIQDIMDYRTTPGVLVREPGWLALALLLAACNLIAITTPA